MSNNKLITSTAPGVAPTTQQLGPHQLGVSTKDSKIYVNNGTEIIDVLGLVFEVPQTVTATRSYVVDGAALSVSPKTANNPFYMSFKTAAQTEVGRLGKIEASSSNHDIKLQGIDAVGLHRDYITNDDHQMVLMSDGRTIVSAKPTSDGIFLRPKGYRETDNQWNIDSGGTVRHRHEDGVAYDIRDSADSGVGISSYMAWSHDDAVRRGWFGYGSASDNHFSWRNEEGAGVPEIVLQEGGRIKLNPGTDNAIDAENSAIYYGRSYCNAAAGGSWGHASFAALALLNTTSGPAYNVFKMGTDGPKMQALGEGGSTVRLYPGGGNANFVAWQPHAWTHYYVGSSSMSWDMFAETANVNTSIRMREDGNNHGVEFGYAGASSDNEFFLNMREGGSDKRALSIHRDRKRAIFNTERLDVESSGAEKLLLYRADGDANVNIRYASSSGADVWAGKTTNNFAIGSASDLSSSGNQWMIIGSVAATFRVPVVLDGGSPSSSHAVRRDWAEDNLLRRNVELVSSQDWNNLVKSGNYRVGGSVGANHPSAPTVGDSYNYGSLLTLNDINATNGVKAQLYFPHNQGSPDTSSRLPVYRSGYTGDYGNWRTLLSLQYADLRYTQTSSDINLKTDIAEIQDATSIVNALGTYSFLKENAEVKFLKEEGEYTGQEEERSFEMGFIAQEVEKVLPHLVGEDQFGYKTIKSKDNTLLAVAYQALKESNKRVDDLETRLKALEKLLGVM